MILAFILRWFPWARRPPGRPSEIAIEIDRRELEQWLFEREHR